MNATTLQYSVNLTDNLLGRATNLLWILSLVFSIASAINSQIANHWQSAEYRSPAVFVPKIVGIWMEHTPLLLLGASVITFSTGLICFTFKVFSDHFFIPLITCLSTTVTSFALITIGLWIASERYVAKNTMSRRWLTSILHDKAKRLIVWMGLESLASRWREPSPSTRRARWRAAVRRTRHRITSMWGTSSIRSRPAVHAPPASSCGVNLPLPLQETKGTQLGSTVATHAQTNSTLGVPGAVLHTSDSLVVSNETHPRHDITMRSDTLTIQALAATMNLRTEAEMLTAPVHVGLQATAFAALSPVVRLPRAASLYSEIITEATNVGPDEEHSTSERVASIVPIVRSLALRRGTTKHATTVRHLEFSPDGRYLATCGSDKLVIIWNIGPPLNVYKVLRTPGGSRMSRLTWSQTGQLAAYSYSRIQIWDIEVKFPKNHKAHSALDVLPRTIEYRASDRRRPA